MDHLTSGDASVVRIEEMVDSTFLAANFFMPFDPEALQPHLHWLAPRYYIPDRGALVFSMHAWIVKTGRHTVLIDTCVGNDKERMPRTHWHHLQTPFLERLRAAGATPESIDYVMCTHLHADHIGWNTVLRDGRWVPTFPNARYLFARIEYDHWQKNPDPSPIRRVRARVQKGFRAPMAFMTRRGVVVMGLALAVTACARTSVENVNSRAIGLPKPQLIVVHDFGVSPGDVSLDSAIGARLIHMMRETPASEEELKIGRDVARIVTENLVKELGKLGLAAVPAATAGSVSVSGPTLSIEGQFVSVNEGNRLRRMVVGFGAGASEVRTLVQAYETTPAGRRLVEDFYTTVKSSIKPGMGPMAGVRAAAGRAATSAMVSGGVGIATERSQGVDGDAKNTAEEITKTR